MATYYVKTTGDDGLAGTSELTAWLTVNKATTTITAGDTCYIAPGVYREFPTFSNNGSDGDWISLIGDPDCEEFLNEIPGEVRITGEQSNGELMSGHLLYLAGKEYWLIKNFRLDGASGAFKYTVYGRRADNELKPLIIDNCHVATTGYTGFRYVHTIKNCKILINGTYGCLYCGHQHNNLFIGGNVASQLRLNYLPSISSKTIVSGNIIIGSYLGFRTYDATSQPYVEYYNNLVMYNGGYGYYYMSEASRNNAYFYGQYGWRYGKPNYTLAHQCYVGYGYVDFTSYTPTNVKYNSMGRDAEYGCTGTAAVYQSGSFLVDSNFSNGIVDLVRNQLINDSTQLSQQWGDPSITGSFISDTDILGNPRQMLSGSNTIDVGGWGCIQESLNYVTTYSLAPSIQLDKIGVSTFYIPANSGSTVTVTCQSMWQGGSLVNKPQMILSGSSITNDLITNTENHDVWQELIISGTLTNNDELKLKLCGDDENDESIVYFSDIDVSIS